MTRINSIQKAVIKELEGGRFQNLCDVYLHKKLQFDNIQSLGSQEGTDKPTKGVPDSYVHHDDNTYSFIMYGTHEKYKRKIKDDITDCLDENKINIPRSKIREIIICHTSTNLSVNEDLEFRNLGEGIKIEIYGLDTISQDLNTPPYQGIAREYLGITPDSGQIFLIEDFVKSNDKSKTASPLDIEFKFRENEIIDIRKLVLQNDAVLIYGASGVGKTRICLEVLRDFEKDGYQVLCVKNNGQFLFDDLKSSISENKKHLVFFDDINRSVDIQAIIGYIQDYSDSLDIKVLATVRDYEKGKISDYLSQLDCFQEKMISVFTKEEIRTILEESLGITNKAFQDRIANISKGNARLAILAGMSAIKDVNSINDSTSIFANYYGKILDEQRIDTNFIKCLFIVSLVKTVKIGEDNFSSTLLNEFSITWDEFKENIIELHQKEWVDYFLEEVVKINDQSFGDYILEYVLIEKKYIKISRLLELGLVSNRKDIVSGLNTIFRVFPSVSSKNYLINQVKEQWGKAQLPGEQELYLECFWSLDLEKSLLILKQRIDNLLEDDFKITEEYFKKKNSNEQISLKELKILSNFKETKYFNDAIELLLEALKRQPSSFMDIYFSMSRFTFDKNSHINDYETEFQFIQKFWQLRQGHEKNFDFLLIKIIEKLLNCSGTFMVEGATPGSIGIVNYSLALTEGTQKLRSALWQMLSELAQNEENRLSIYHILIGNHWNGIIDPVSDILEYDFRAIKKYFVDNWEQLTFEQCLVLMKLVDSANYFNISPDRTFRNFEKYSSYKYLEVLESKMVDESWSEYIEIQFERISKLTSSFNLNDYKRLFLVAKNLEDTPLNSSKWENGENLLAIIKGLSSNQLQDILNFYFKEGAPFSFQILPIVNKMIDNWGFKKTYDLINKFDFPSKNIWNCEIWSNIPDELISESTEKLLLKFTSEQLNGQFPTIPRLKTFLKFLEIDKNIVGKIGNLLLDGEKIGRKIISDFLREYNQNPQDLVQVFRGHLDLLEKFYLLGLDTAFDFKGILLLEIIKLDFSFWAAYVQSIDNGKMTNGFIKDLLHKVWSLDNFKQYIDVAYYIIVVNPQTLSFFSEYTADAFFPIQKEEDSEVNNHIKEWCLNYINENNTNSELIIKFFSVFVSFQNTDIRIEYIREFLLSNENFKDFESIPLFPGSKGWTGSEVPSIDNDISFLQNLKERDFLSGIKFIEHRAYIQECITGKELYKRKVQLLEYREDFL